MSLFLDHTVTDAMAAAGAHRLLALGKAATEAGAESIARQVFADMIAAAVPQRSSAADQYFGIMRALKAQRLESGRRATEIASKIGKSRMTLYRWETFEDTPDLLSICSLAAHLGMALYVTPPLHHSERTAA